MDDKKILTSVPIKQEGNASMAKKVLLSSATFPPLMNKHLSSARLPSFKPPRDLFLTGTVTGNSNSTFNFNSNTKSTKRTFVPNVHVTRRKGNCETPITDSTPETNQKNKDKDKNKKGPYNKSKRNPNIVQTKGVFSEGLAPGRVKAYGSTSGDRVSENSQMLDKPKLNLTKAIHKLEEDSKLKSLLKDDFIDDPSQVPDINFIPKSLPLIYNVKATDPSDDLEKTFETLQVKNEKKVSHINVDKENNILSSDFDGNQGPKMLLFEFPSLLREAEDTAKKKKALKKQQCDANSVEEKCESLSSLGEGFFGYLRIHENGRAFLVVGKTIIPLCENRHGTRQEIMSAAVEKETLKGELISLGTIDSSFTCSANIFQGVKYA